MPGVVSIGGVGTSKLRIAIRNGGAVGGKYQQQRVPDHEARRAQLRAMTERMKGRAAAAPAVDPVTSDKGE